MSAAARWEVLPARAGFADMAPRWDALNALLYDSHPLLSSRFVAPLVDYFAGPGDLLAVQGDGRNLLLCSRANALMWGSFQPSQAQIAPVLIADSDIAPGLLRRLPGCNLAFDLYNQDPLFTAFSEDAADPTTEFVRHALTTSIDMNVGFDTYWAGRSAKLRQNVNRYIRRAESDGFAARMVMVESAAELPAALARYGELESSGWKGDAGTAVHIDNDQGRFYRNVLMAFAGSGNATIYELYLGDQLAASRIAIASPHMQVMLKTTYAESLAKFAPGRILLYLVLEHEFTRRRSQWIEFYTNAAQELVTWSTHTRTIRHVTFYRNAAVRSAFVHYRKVKLLRRGGDSAPAEDEASTVEGIKTVAVTSLDQLPASGAKLLKRASKHNLFLLPAWFDNLVRHVAVRHDEAYYITAQHSNGKMLGILPLWLRREHAWLNVRALRSLANYYTALYDVVIDDEAGNMEATVAALVDGVCERRSDWDMFVLSPVADNAAWLPLMQREFERRGMQTAVSTAFVNWYMPHSKSSFADYLTARPSELRNTILRKTRKLDREHATHFRLITGADGLEQAMTDYERIYGVSWKRFEPYPEFIRAFAALCAERKWLRLGLLDIDGEPAAAQIWVVYNHTASIYKLAFDPRFAALSVGSILSMKLMEYVFEHDHVTEIDFLTGDDAFKKSWVTHSRRRVSLDVFNSHTVRGRLLSWRRRVGEFLRGLGSRGQEHEPRG